ncbi:MAG: hypothetical protein IKX79_01645, partial [Desulfovibrionaceae bacterium]|nr:hypothetical protein [Desulfovibrionaceae bacterium]
SDLRQKIVESVNAYIDRICLMGCSLGGFYALHMRHPAICHIVAWNPAVFPAAQLKDFVGTQTRFTDGEEWEFTDEALYSYAAAPDPRPWLNDVWLEERRLAQHSWEKEQPSLCLSGAQRVTFSPSEGAGEKGGLPPAEREARFEPPRDIFLGTRDELINHRLTRAYWQGWANLHKIESGHQIADYSHAAELLKKGMLSASFADWRPGEKWAEEFANAGHFDMAGIFPANGREEEVCDFMWKFDQSYLRLQGVKDGREETLFAVFFHARFEPKERRLLRGLAAFCGAKRFAFLRADSTGASHVLAARPRMDSESPAALPKGCRSFSGAVQALFKGWQGQGAHWQGHVRHGSWITAMERGMFAQRWDACEDPIAKCVAIQAEAQADSKKH